MNANERKCFFRANRGGPVRFSFLLKQEFSGLVTTDCCENRNDIASPDQYFICVHLRDAHGCANAAGAGCTRAEQFADSSFIA
jgi:hypothetical protein